MSDIVHLVHRGTLGKEPSPLFDAAGRIVGSASEIPWGVDCTGSLICSQVTDPDLIKRLDTGAHLSVTRDGEPAGEPPIEVSADDYTSYPGYTRVGVERSTSGLSVPAGRRER